MKPTIRKPNKSASNSESSSDTEANIKKSLVSRGTLNKRVSKKLSRKQLVREEEMNENISDVDLEEVEDPRQRELLLLAKVRVLKDKLENKNKIINQMKETLSSDEQVKRSMEKKIDELKVRIDEYHGELLMDEDPKLHDQINVNIKAKNKHEVNNQILKECRGMEYMLGSTALANEHQSRIFIVENRTCLGRIHQRFTKIINFFQPFQSNMEMIQYRYNEDVIQLFRISRKIFTISILVLFCYIAFDIIHILNWMDTLAANPNDAIYCKFKIPCVMFYSRISQDLQSVFMITLLATTIIITTLSLLFWNHYNGMRLNSKLYEKDNRKFSAFFFNVWDWSIRTQPAYEDKKSNLRTLFMNSVNEFELREKIKVRTCGDQCGKFSLRIVSWFLSLLVLIVYAAFILGGYFLRNYIKLNVAVFTGPLQKYSISEILIEFIPPCIFSLSTILFPQILMKLDCMDQWDYYSTKENARSFRYFISRVVGVGVLLFVNIYFNLLGGSLGYLSSLTGISLFFSTIGCPYPGALANSRLSIGTSTVSSLYSNCPEDDVAVNLLLVILSEFIIRKIYDLIAFGLLYCFSSRRKAGKSYKNHINHHKILTDYLIFFILLYSCLIFFPLLSVLIPLFLFIEFKYNVFKLLKMRTYPHKISFKPEDGYVLMIIFNISAILVIGLYCIFFIAVYQHNNFMECYDSNSGYFFSFTSKLCGPFATFQSGNTVILNEMNKTRIIGKIYNIVASPLLLLILIMFIFIKIVISNNDLKSFKFYITEKEHDTNENIHRLQDEIDALKRGKKETSANILK